MLLLKMHNDFTLYFRYNDFTHDPLSRCNCTPPYSGENSISARCDLNPANGTYPFGALGHRSHGGTDMKVTTLYSISLIQVCTCTSTSNAIVFSSLQSIAISIINIMSIRCTYWYVPVKLKLFVYCNIYSNFYYFWLEVR